MTQKNKKRKFTLPLSHIRSCWKLGLAATVVVVQRWLGSKVTLMLSLTGKISVSSLFPQYLITDMLVGVWAVTISTQFCDSPAISSSSNSTITDTRLQNQNLGNQTISREFQMPQKNSGKVGGKWRKKWRESRREGEGEESKEMGVPQIRL